MKAIEILKTIKGHRIPEEYYRIIPKSDNFDIIDVCKNNKDNKDKYAFKSY